MAKILCIDSNPDFLEKIEALLKHEGYHVETALLGASGYNKFRSFGPDLVLLNLHLSDMKGLDLLEKLHAQSLNVPVAVFTGYGCDDDVVVEAHSRGAADFILKTVPVSTLSLRIKTLLRNYQAIRTKEKLAIPSVMVIDDNLELCNLIRTYLEKSGNNVYVINDPAKAMEALRNHKVNLVFLDIVMPGINGLDLLDQIKRFDNDLPVVMVSSVSADEVIESALKKGADDYICKPFTFEQLKVSVIKNALV